uniref:Uncharacterized protein n=1 Tax=Rhizophagus irregularis (strain DAOM 181602 / DAOM 197198 / MUCL 43194) TaxID=747089 RepID=U9SZ88_RHIID
MITKEEILACINSVNLNVNPYETLWRGKVESYSEKIQGFVNKEKISVIKLRDIADGQTYKLVKKTSDLSADLLVRLERKCQEDFEGSFPYSLNEHLVKNFLMNEKLVSLKEENASLTKQLRQSEEQNLQLQRLLGQFQEQQIQIKQEEIEQTSVQNPTLPGRFTQKRIRTLKETTFQPEEVEDLVSAYSRNNDNIQECESSKSNTIIIQRKFRTEDLYYVLLLTKILVLRFTQEVVTDTGEKMTTEKEHLSSDLIPELLIDKILNLEEHNDTKDKGKLRTDVNLSIWTNTNYAYYEDADIFSIHFLRKYDVLHDYCDHIGNLLIGYVLDNKIISIEIFDASTFLYCHLFDCNERIDDKRPLFLYSIYYEDRNELSVYFTGYPPTTRLQSIEVEKDVLMQISDNGKLVALLIRNAKDRIAREISKEDREKLREEFKLRHYHLNH